MNHPRSRWVDAAKGIAIFGVILSHCDPPSEYNLRYVLNGAKGVQLFYLISGFLTFISLSRAYPGNHISFRQSGRWLLQKYFRLLPLYLICLAVSSLGGGAPYWHGDSSPLTLPNLGAHLLMVHSLFPRFANSIASLEWYLGTLWVFYLLSPLLYRLLSSFRKTFAAFVLLCGVSCLSDTFLLTIVPSSSDSYIYSSFVGFFFLHQLPVYVLGILLYHCSVLLYESHTNERKKRLVSYVLQCLFWLLLVLQCTQPFSFGIFSSTIICGILMFGLCFSQVLYATFPFTVSALAFLGKHSYGIYLFHFIILCKYDILVAPLLRFVPGTVLPWAIKILLCTCASALLTVFLEKYYDTPIQNRIHALLTRKGN